MYMYIYIYTYIYVLLWESPRGVEGLRIRRNAKKYLPDRVFPIPDSRQGYFVLGIYNSCYG